MKYQQRPVEAMQFTGFEEKHYLSRELAFFLETVVVCGDKSCLVIHTPTESFTVKEGDWIIKNIKGEFSSCSPEAFKQNYEVVDGSDIVSSANCPYCHKRIRYQ